MSEFSAPTRDPAPCSKEPCTNGAASVICGFWLCLADLAPRVRLRRAARRPRARLATRAQDVEPHQPGHAQCPGLVFGMLSGGSCRGMVFRVPQPHARQVLVNLWQREMPVAVYDPRWLTCHTPQGPCRRWPSRSRAAAPATPASCTRTNTAASSRRPVAAMAARTTMPRHPARPAPGRYPRPGIGTPAAVLRPAARRGGPGTMTP